ncbi:hypothetical protein WR25_23962 [Diploscapter pachys]|uniref:Uncharacterized protein n=1 Tax=Diploscapter pachys TaxID=2018661 RepID=A0A2A2LAH3_9BILA|nr:hypothetical protein WR25_23962 [Diploscapter pachys]
MHLTHFILPFLCLFLSSTIIRPTSAALLFQPSFYAHLFSPIRSSVATSTTTTEQPVVTMQPARVVAPRGLSGENPDRLQKLLRWKLERAFEEMQAEGLDDMPFPARDYFSDGIAEQDEKIYLYGERYRGTDVSKFCGSLASKHLQSVEEPLRDAIIFEPGKPIPLPVVSLTLLIPRQWFRLTESDTFTTEPTLFICYEGENVLNLFKVTIYQSDFALHRHFYKYKHNHQFNAQYNIRGLALLLNNQWNNANLLPRNTTASVIIETKSIVKRQTYTRHCDRRLALNQDCCLWPFTYNYNGTEILFHRCVGKVPIENDRSSIFQDSSIYEDLARGNMGRRFVTVQKKICRESRFQLTQLLVQDPKYGRKSLTISNLDARECATFY